MVAGQQDTLLPRCPAFFQSQTQLLPGVPLPPLRRADAVADVSAVPEHEVRQGAGTVVDHTHHPAVGPPDSQPGMGGDPALALLPAPEVQPLLIGVCVFKARTALEAAALRQHLRLESHDLLLIFHGRFDQF